MQTDILRKVGEFFHGDEWQAPLARDLGVNERSMRRWLAGTENVPKGVWKDLGSKLELYQRSLGILVSAVNHAADLVEVHAFKVWDHRAGEMVQPRGKSTADRIAQIGGAIIPGSAEWLPSASVDAEGRMILKPHQKQQLTASEFEEMILARLGVVGARVGVHRDPVYGWHPTVYTTPERAVGTQQAVEGIANELRADYELSEEAPQVGRPLSVFVAHKPREA
jgi:hypothetical protein